VCLRVREVCAYACVCVCVFVYVCVCVCTAMFVHCMVSAHVSCYLQLSALLALPQQVCPQHQ